MSVPRRLRAPQQNGAVLAEPPLADVSRLLAANRRLLANDATILGRSWVVGHGVPSDGVPLRPFRTIIRPDITHHGPSS